MPFPKPKPARQLKKNTSASKRATSKQRGPARPSRVSSKSQSRRSKKVGSRGQSKTRSRSTTTAASRGQSKTRSRSTTTAKAASRSRSRSVRRGRTNSRGREQSRRARVSGRSSSRNASGKSAPKASNESSRRARVSGRSSSHNASGKSAPKASNESSRRGRRQSRRSSRQSSRLGSQRSASRSRSSKSRRSSKSGCLNLVSNRRGRSGTRRSQQSVLARPVPVDSRFNPARYRTQHVRSGISAAPSRAQSASGEASVLAADLSQLRAIRASRRTQALSGQQRQKVKKLRRASESPLATAKPKSLTATSCIPQPTVSSTSSGLVTLADAKVKGVSPRAQSSPKRSSQLLYELHLTVEWGQARPIRTKTKFWGDEKPSVVTVNGRQLAV